MDQVGDLRWVPPDRLLEEHLDIPPFAVDADNFLVRKVDLGGEDGQPVSHCP